MVTGPCGWSQQLDAMLGWSMHPIGDSPKMMPQDSSLFEDLHASMWHHATWRTLLENDDPWKFSLKMPKETACLYTCLFDLTLSYEVGVPCSWHILQDSKSFISDCKAIRDARGVVVPGLGSRKGCRQGNVVSIVNANHSGARGKKDSPEKTWVHPVVIEGFALLSQKGLPCLYSKS